MKSSVFFSHCLSLDHDLFEIRGLSFPSWWSWGVAQPRRKSSGIPNIDSSSKKGCSQVIPHRTRMVDENRSAHLLWTLGASCIEIAGIECRTIHKGTVPFIAFRWFYDDWFIRTEFVSTTKRRFWCLVRCEEKVGIFNNALTWECRVKKRDFCFFFDNRNVIGLVPLTIRFTILRLFMNDSS